MASRSRSSARPKLDTLNAVIEHIDAIDIQHADAHSRLRKDHDALASKVEATYDYLRGRVELTASQLEKLTNEVQHVNNAPVSLDKLMFTPRVVGLFVAWLLAVVATVIVTFLATTSGLRTDQAALRSDVRDIITRMEANKTADTARANLQDVQSSALRNTVDDMKRQLQMQQYDIQNLKDLVTGRKKP